MTTILDINWTTAAAGTGPWTATTGETWTRSGTASVSSGVLTIPTANNVNTPDQAGLAVGKNILDIRIECALTSWGSGVLQNVLNQYVSGFGSGSRWYFAVRFDGAFQYGFANLGGTITATSSAATGFTAATSHGIRMVHAVSAGTVDFYTSTDFTNWTPLGVQQTGFATTAMDTGGTAPIVRLGTDADAEPAPGTYTRTQVFVTPSAFAPARDTHTPIPFTRGAGGGGKI